MASEAITRTDLTEILNAVLPIDVKGVYCTTLLKRKAITANSTHTLYDDISNYDAFVITVFNNSSAGSGNSTFITKAQLVNDPTTVTASMSFGTQYAIVGITGMSGTTLSIGFVNIAGGITPYMSIIGLKFGASGGVEDVDHIVEEGTGYRKWNSGKLECWGSASLASNATYARCTFGLSFVDTNYTALGVLVGTPISAVSIGSKTTGYVDIGTSASSYARSIAFFAIGRWK